MFITKKLKERVDVLEEKVEKLIQEKSDTFMPSVLTALSSLAMPSPAVSKFEFESVKDKLHDMDKRIALLEAKNSCNCHK